jgi:quercetin dioxygenase-like cupin family protein
MEEDGQYRAFPVFPFDQRKKFEIYTLEIEAGCSHESEPHNEGVEEYILMMQGELEVSFHQETYRLKGGDAIHFSADQQHTYRNLADYKTVYHTIIFYPS